MPIFTELNREVSGRVLEDFPATLGQSLEARFARSFNLAPTSSAVRLFNLERAKGGREREHAFGFAGAVVFGGFGPAAGFTAGQTLARATEPERDITEFISPGEANEIGKPLGLNFERIITREAFGIIVRRKQLELARASLIERGPKGFAPGVLGFGVELFAQAVDPLNVVSAFIPVVGEARFAIMAAKLGKGRARLFRGAAEGFVGNLAIEPIVAINATREQADYMMLDSLMNLAFGTILGGGLHFVGIGGRGFTQAELKLRPIERGQKRLFPLTKAELEREVPLTKTELEKRQTRLAGEGRLQIIKERLLEKPPPLTNAQRVERLNQNDRGKIQSAAISDAIEGRRIDVDPAFRVGEEGTELDVNSIYKRADDPKAKRLTSEEVSQQGDEILTDAPDFSDVKVAQRLVDEDELIFQAEVKQIAETEAGRKVLGDAGLTVKKDGTVSSSSLREATTAIETATTFGKAFKALKTCLGR